MSQLLNFNIDCSWSYIDILICLIPVIGYKPIRRSSFNPNQNSIHAVHKFITMTHMTCRCYDATFSLTFGTLLLELLYKSWSYLLLLDNHSLALALGACFHMIRVISTRATAMWANDFPVVSDFKVSSIINLLECDPYFKSDARSSLLLSMTSHSEHIEDPSEWILLLWLIQTAFSTAVIFTTQFRVTQSLISICHVMEFAQSFIVPRVFVWMVLQCESSIAFLDLSWGGILFEVQYAIEISALILLSLLSSIGSDHSYHTIHEHYDDA